LADGETGFVSYQVFYLKSGGGAHRNFITLIANLTADAKAARLAVTSPGVQVKRMSGRNLRYSILTSEAFRAEEGDESRVENGELRLSPLPPELLRLDDWPEAG
jgi:hypothetical protein